MAMAIPRGAVVANLYDMLPRALHSTSFAASYAARTTTVSWSSIIPSASITIPAMTLNIPDAISDIWEGILRAVPKKKTSHMKKRHRQLAGKALKDVKSLVRCPACGKPKKAHMLCPYCVAEIGPYYFGTERERRLAKRSVKEVEQGESFSEEGRNERRESKTIQEKAHEDHEVEETNNGVREAETFKEPAVQPAEQRSSTEDARVPARKRGGWRNELKYL